MAGLSYATFCLSANACYATVEATDPDVEKVLRRYERSAELFPLRMQFRVLPAYYLIFQVQVGGRVDWRLRAIGVVEDALKSTPNSIYLRAHLNKLRWGSP